MADSHQVRVNLLGTSFSIQTDEKPEQVYRVLDHLRSTVEKVQKASKTQDPLKLSILSSMVLADELLRRQSNEEQKSGLSLDDADLASRAQSLVKKIDETISRYSLSSD